MKLANLVSARGEACVLLELELSRQTLSRALAGLGLRRTLPVTPVDAAFRAVLSAYAAPGGGPQQHE